MERMEGKLWLLCKINKCDVISGKKEKKRNKKYMMLREGHKVVTTFLT